MATRCYAGTVQRPSDGRDPHAPCAGAPSVASSSNLSSIAFALQLDYIALYNYESQLCWAELPRVLNEVKYSNTGREERFAGS